MISDVLDIADIADLIDEDRYPVRHLDCPEGIALVERARQQLTETGAVELAGFIRPDRLQMLVDDAEALAARSHHSEGEGTAYLEVPDCSLPEGHPRLTWGHYGVGAVGYDVIPRTSLLRSIYEWEPLRRLLEAILDRGSLYRYADPFGALNLAVMGDGDELQWHFDQTDFVTSLAIQAPKDGGAFEVAPRIRSADDERYDRVSAVLAGDRSDVVVLPMTPGTLLVFEGRHSLHRVSPVGGARFRHMGLLAYDTEPDRQGSALLRHERYGRSTPFDEPPVRWPVS